MKGEEKRKKRRRGEERKRRRRRKEVVFDVHVKMRNGVEGVEHVGEEHNRRQPGVDLTRRAGGTEVQGERHVYNGQERRVGCETERSRGAGSRKGVSVGGRFGRCAPGLLRGAVPSVAGACCLSPTQWHCPECGGGSVAFHGCSPG